MAKNEKKDLWKAAYLASIHFGSSASMALSVADQAVIDFEERWEGKDSKPHKKSK